MDELDLSMFFNTKGQAADFAARLGAVAEQIYSTTFNLEKVLMDQFGMQKKDRLLALLRESNVPLNSQTTLRDFFAKLQDYVTHLPVLSLTIAFEPKDVTLKAISEWLLLNLKKQMVLDLTYDPTLLAGATISYNGRHGNYSIKPKFDEILKNMLSPQPTPIQSGAKQPAATPQEQPAQTHPVPNQIPPAQPHSVPVQQSTAAVPTIPQHPVQPAPLPPHPVIQPAIHQTEQIQVGR